MKSHYLWLFSKHIDVSKLEAERDSLEIDGKTHPHCQLSFAGDWVTFLLPATQQTVSSTSTWEMAAVSQPSPSFQA